MPDEPIVAIGLLTRSNLERLGGSFSAAIPVPEDCAFDDLLARLDAVEIERVGKGVLLRAEADAPPESEKR